MIDDSKYLTKIADTLMCNSLLCFNWLKKSYYLFLRKLINDSSVIDYLSLNY